MKKNPETVENGEEIVRSTWRQALYLWVGLSLALTLFFVQSQMFFINSKPAPSSKIEWFFWGLGFVTFLFGLLFFQYYTRFRKKRLDWMPPEERKQTLLVTFVIQFVLFETLGLYGVLVSVLTQNATKSLPFIVFAYLGFILVFPRKEKIKVFFVDSSPEEKTN